VKAISRDMRQLVPIRSRVAFVLAVAGKALPALENHRDALDAVAQALADGWRWEEGETISSLQLYEKDDEALALQGCLVKEQAALGAIMAATSAFYYMLWNAYKLDLNRGQVRRGEVPNMGEVSEEVMDEVCQYATQSGLCDEKWVNAVAERLIRDYRTDKPEELGAVVPRQYFN
jgi:uncharacterized protein with von Willebrand factor type A (vWA) domain